MVYQMHHSKMMTKKKDERSTFENKLHILVFIIDFRASLLLSFIPFCPVISFDTIMLNVFHFLSTLQEAF